MITRTTFQRRCVASLTAIAMGALLACQSVHAGRSCAAPQPPKPQTIERGLNLAERTLKALDASGAQVVVLARAGQDLSKYNLRFSHLGFAYRTSDGQGGQVWRVLHKLNQCGTATSAIYRQGLGEFFLDDLWRYEAAWMVPTPEVQTKLLALLQNEPRAIALHHKPYSLVSYAWSQKYQQSNQWAIETLAMAMSAPAEPGPAAPVNNRAQAQAWLQSKGYQPSVLTIGPVTRLGARASAANVAFDDHPSAKRFTDHIETVTVDSVFAWMPRAGLTTKPVVVLNPAN